MSKNPIIYKSSNFCLFVFFFFLIIFSRGRGRGAQRPAYVPSAGSLIAPLAHSQSLGGRETRVMAADARREVRASFRKSKPLSRVVFNKNEKTLIYETELLFSLKWSTSKSNTDFDFSPKRTLAIDKLIVEWISNFELSDKNVRICNISGNGLFGEWRSSSSAEGDDEERGSEGHERRQQQWRQREEAQEAKGWCEFLIYYFRNSHIKL